ncbi:MAG TPA: thiol peroxidase [Desulfobacteraceae bacterium]|nr:thiol peroxidase [Desulfobacteraceae bacterium]
MDRKQTKMGGNLITLLGPELKAGDKAPDFNVRSTELFQVTLSDYRGKPKLISVAPSLDTTVCDRQTRRINQEATDLQGRVKFISMSMDLPFALKRWAMNAGPLALELLSDYIDASFGMHYGVLIQELRLLNRSLFLIDDQDVIRYMEVVEENYSEPDYDRAFDALRRLL